MSPEVIAKFKQKKQVQKFMKKYRYEYHITMVTDLATLAYEFYLEGYNNGLQQHPVLNPEPETIEV